MIEAIKLWVRKVRTGTTLCFTPPSRGKRPCYTSPPIEPGEFAHFATQVVERYAQNGKRVPDPASSNASASTA